LGKKGGGGGHPLVILAQYYIQHYPIGGYYDRRNNSLVVIGGAFGTKYSEGTKHALRVIGFIFLIIGLSWTFLIAILQTLDSYSLQMVIIQRYISRNISQITFVISNFVFWITFGSIALFTIFVLTIRKLQIERGYKVQYQPLIGGDPGNPIAIIQTTNIGHSGEFSCAARLVKIGLQPERDFAAQIPAVLHLTDDPEPLDYIQFNIHEINPRGYYLRWDDGRASAVLQEDLPRIIGFAYPTSRNQHTIKFVFSDDFFSNPMPLGVYDIVIELFRIKKSSKLEKMATLELTLHTRVHYGGNASPIYGDGIDFQWEEKPSMPQEKTKWQKKKPNTQNKKVTKKKSSRKKTSSKP